MVIVQENWSNRTRDIFLQKVVVMEDENTSQPPANFFVCSNSSNTTVNAMIPQLTVVDLIVIVSHALIFISGMLGNGLVIYVVSRFTKMKTVTNMYILNLAISDMVFLISIPFTTTTHYLKYWPFGNAFCKIYFVFYSISFFGGVFTLTALSVDRYLAVCHAVKSQKYRKPQIASLIILAIWSVAFLVMLPTILYARTIPNHILVGRLTCTIEWPKGQLIPTDKAYVWYTFLLGFSIPVSLVTVFYVLVIVKLKHVGPGKKSKERRKNHKKVTRLVLAVITVYVVCWLPYWGFQVNLTFEPPNSVPPYAIVVFSFITILSYSNSMLNPILYAFLGENFRKSFMIAFRCKKIMTLKKNWQKGISTLPKQRKSRDFTSNKTAIDETIEMQITNENFDTIGQAPEVPEENNCFDKECSTRENSLIRKTFEYNFMPSRMGNVHNLIVSQNGTTELQTDCNDEPFQLVDKEIQTKIII